MINNRSLVFDQVKKEITDKNKFASVFITTFSTVFLAELGDKTQIATLLLTAQSGRPLIVFLGSAAALILSSLVGVILGRWLAKIIPAQRLEYMAGTLMVGIGLYLGLEASQTLMRNLSS